MTENWEREREIERERERDGERERFEHLFLLFPKNVHVLFSRNLVNKDVVKSAIWAYVVHKVVNNYLIERCNTACL